MILLLLVFFLFGCIYLYSHLHQALYLIGDIVTGSWKGRGNQYVQLVKGLYYKLSTNGKQRPAFLHEVRPTFKL